MHPHPWPGEQEFLFHPRSTNPELWRTTVPLVVRQRCGRHKGLIATWTAIHWLIVLHAASGRTHFGMREIAEEAGVGRNELAGPTGYIQRLVDLSLIRIVGYKPFPGLREPRPIYHIDLAELERQSLDLVPSVLREHHIDRPPPAADPRQLQLALVPAEDAGSQHQPASRHPVPESKTAVSPSVLASPHTPHEHGTDYAVRTPPRATRRYAPRRVTHENGTAETPSRLASPAMVREPHENGTAHARNRDVDRTNERTNEGASQTLTPDMLQSLVTQTTQAVLTALRVDGRSLVAGGPEMLTAIPPAPAGAEPLLFSVLELWQGDSPTVSRRETHQLALIAGNYNEPTGGHGAYWLGRAILMADFCLGERGQARSLAYLRQILRRWREEGSWGSDRDSGEAALRVSAASTARPALKGTDRETGREESSAPRAQHVAKVPAGNTHPAVAAYVEALHETPNTVQATQIAAIVTNLTAWRQVLTDWQLNGWGERSVGKMLDRYQKALPSVAASEPPPSVAVIHRYPGLTDEQRDRWITRFHTATTPAEKRAVLNRLKQEHS